MKKSLLVLALGVVGASANASVFIFSHGPIAIVDNNPATPAVFAVAGLDGVIIDVDIILDGISHTFPDDTGAVLENNVGANVLLWDGAGDDFGTDMVDLVWRFDDSAAAPLTDSGPLASGSFQPGQDQYADPFTLVTGPPYGATMAGLNGGGNGNWTLFIEDFVGGDFGDVDGASLIITTRSVPEPASIAALGLGAAALLRRRRK